MTTEEATVRRIFIGNISNALAQTPEDLSNRLSKFGTVRSPLELHFNEVRQSSFAYIGLEMSQKDYIKLKGSLHGVNFKGSKLVVDLAKDDFTKRWEEDSKRPNEAKKAKILKQQWEHYKKLENIKKTHKDRLEVIPGRLRAIPRKDIKKMTLRVNFNGELKTIKLHKTKLWGYEKNKNVRDLVYRFANGYWKDGNEHIVERLNTVQLKQKGNSLTIERLSDDREDGKLLETLVDSEDEEKELQKNNKVLASILGSFDFDKKIEYKEDLDEFGASDYEYEGAYKSEGDDEGLGHSDHDDLPILKYQKEGEFAKKQANSNVLGAYEDEDDVDEMDVDDNDDDDNDDDDLDTEFLPTVGQASTSEAKDEVKLVEGTVSNTETLRTLFNTEVEGETSFKLIQDSDDDIDKMKKPVATDLKLPDLTATPTIGSLVSKAKKTKGLFFPHFESPFLVAQTQLNQITKIVDLENWESEFWENRSEWTKQLKSRKRDVLRQLRKKNAKNSRVFV